MKLRPPLIGSHGHLGIPNWAAAEKSIKVGVFPEAARLV